MNNPYIEDLTIENFKCFKHLEVKNIGRVNLIGGKNNVGKTAFLEAIEVYYALFKDISGFSLLRTTYNIFKRRHNVNDINDFHTDFIFNNASEIKMESLNKDIVFLLKVEENPKSITSLVNHKFTASIPLQFIETDEKFNHFKKKTDLIYIYPSKINQKQIAIFYSALIERRMKFFLDKSLSLFDSNILSLEQIMTEKGVSLKLELKDREKLVLLSSLGEGINRYIAILCAIWASKDSVLLIDEIENGIHYTNYKKLWQIIFQASIDANCQLFITTHSKECIAAFNDVQFENEQCNAQYFEFYRNLKTDLIKASAINKERLQYSLTHDGRVRGE